MKKTEIILVYHAGDKVLNLIASLLHFILVELESMLSYNNVQIVKIIFIVSAAVGYLGAALSVSQGRDIALKYIFLMADIGRYAEDGAQLLIEKGWLEQLPLAEDRRKLVSKD